MKKKVKIKDEYNIKIKKRILREIKDSEKKFITTYKEIQKYFKIFNKSLFKNKLNPFNDIKIKRIIKGSGQCVEYLSFRKGTTFFVLEMMTEKFSSAEESPGDTEKIKSSVASDEIIDSRGKQGRPSVFFGTLWPHWA